MGRPNKPGDDGKTGPCPRRASLESSDPMPKPRKRPLKIAVYAICLNEEAFVDRFVDRVTGADLIVIADTGSTDGTVAAFERRGVNAHTIAINPWRFDEARNAALALIPDDVDICISLDMDELIMPNWRRVVEDAWRPPINHLMYTHAWARDVTGLWQNHLDNRIHARHGFSWRFPCHETILPDGVPDHIGIVRHLIIEHHPDPTKSRGGYLPLLELAVREDPDSSRHAFYLGREYLFHERYDEALVELGRYLKTGPEHEIGQLCAGRRLVARAREARDGPEAGLEAWRAAAEAAPDVRGPQIDYAWKLYNAEQWAACYTAAVKAIELPEMIVEYGCDSDFGVLAEDMASICGWRLGHQNQALIYGRQALAKAPAIDRIRLNVERMEQALGVATMR